MTVEPDRAELAQITTHVADGKAVVPRQFREKERFNALLQPWLKQIQDLENAAWEIVTEVLTLDAVGAQLDQVGEILLFRRGELNDDDYRAILRAIVRARKSHSIGEDLLAVFRLAMPGIDFTAAMGWASVYFEPHEPIPSTPAALLYVLRLAKAGGVQLELFVPPAAETALFTLAPGLLIFDDADRGFSDVDLADGGLLTGVIT
jgi:hypothetical protein